MSSKRKNDIVVSEYDQTWYGRFYRWLNWDVTEEVIIKASPEVCLEYLKPDKDRERYQLYYPHFALRPYYTYTVKTQTDKRPYWFRVQVNFPGVGKHGSYRSHVFASIVRYDDDEDTSLITFRTYPFGFFFGIGLNIGLIIGLGIPLYSVLRPSGLSSSCLSMTYILALVAFLASIERFYTIFTACRESLVLMKDYLLSLNHRLEDKITHETVYLVGEYPKKKRP